MTTLSDGSLVLANQWLRRLRPVLDGELPKIQINPQDQTIEVGGQAILSVTVENPDTVSYQWLREGRPLTGATNDTLATSSSGAYAVVVMNESAFVISRTAEVTIPLRLKVERISNLVRISMVGEPNVQYRLLNVSDLRVNYWDQIAFQSSPSGMIEFIVPNTDNRQRFFQVARFDF